MKIICTCGGDVSITSESLYGRTVERCYGSCGYEGPPRPPLEELHLNADADPDWPLCVEECGRKTYTPRAMRCRACDAKRKHLPPPREAGEYGMCVEHCGRRVYAKLAKRCTVCATERHHAQKVACVTRYDQRVAKEKRAQKRRPVDTQGAAIGAQRVTSEAV